MGVVGAAVDTGPAAVDEVGGTTFALGAVLADGTRLATTATVVLVTPEVDAGAVAVGPIPLTALPLGAVLIAVALVTTTTTVVLAGPGIYTFAITSAATASTAIGGLSGTGENGSEGPPDNQAGTAKEPAARRIVARLAGKII